MTIKKTPKRLSNNAARLKRQIAILTFMHQRFSDTGLYPFSIEIATHFNIQRSIASRFLTKMRDAGLVRRVGHGLYVPTPITREEQGNG